MNLFGRSDGAQDHFDQDQILNHSEFNAGDVSRIIEMAWEDRTPFEAIQLSYGLDESALMRLMKENLKSNAYRLWRKRVKEKSSKHAKLRNPLISRAYCPTQYKP